MSDDSEDKDFVFPDWFDPHREPQVIHRGKPPTAHFVLEDALRLEVGKVYTREELIALEFDKCLVGPYYYDVKFIRISTRENPYYAEQLAAYENSEKTFNESVERRKEWKALNKIYRETKPFRDAEIKLYKKLARKYGPL